MDNTKNSIVNLSEYGIDPSTIAGFLNERLYTDCHSKLLYNVNGKKAMAVRVERTGFKPEWAGAYYCTKNIEQYRAPIKLVGEPLEVVLYRGNWGRWGYDYSGGPCPRHCGDIEYKVGDIINGKLIVVDWGEEDVRFAYLLPSRKPAKKFYKYGKLEEHCGQFHDYNF